MATDATAAAAATLLRGRLPAMRAELATCHSHEAHAASAVYHGTRYVTMLRARRADAQRLVDTKATPIAMNQASVVAWTQLITMEQRRVDAARDAVGRWRVRIEQLRREIAHVDAQLTFSATERIDDDDDDDLRDGGEDTWSAEEEEDEEEDDREEAEEAEVAERPLVLTPAAQGDGVDDDGALQAAKELIAEDAAMQKKVQELHTIEANCEDNTRERQRLDGELTQLLDDVVSSGTEALVVEKMKEIDAVRRRLMYGEHGIQITLATIDTHLGRAAALQRKINDVAERAVDRFVLLP